MGEQSKRTCAPAPLDSSASHLIPPAAPQFLPLQVPPFLPPSPHLVLPPTFPSTRGTTAWMPPRPPQSAAVSSAPCWLAGLHQPSAASSSAQGPCWSPPASSSDLQGWGLDSHPPGGFLSIFKNTPSRAQGAGHRNSSQPMNIDDDTNSGDGERTEKRLPWTKEEDHRLVSSWLNNSNDPIQLQEERAILE